MSSFNNFNFCDFERQSKHYIAQNLFLNKSMDLTKYLVNLFLFVYLHSKYLLCYLTFIYLYKCHSLAMAKMGHEFISRGS